MKHQYMSSQQSNVHENMTLNTKNKPRKPKLEVVMKMVLVLCNKSLNTSFLVPLKTQ